MKHGSMETPPLPAGSGKGADVDVCPLPQWPDLSGVAVVVLHPQPPPADYLAAIPIAKDVAEAQLGECMLLSW